METTDIMNNEVMDDVTEEAAKAVDAVFALDPKSFAGGCGLTMLVGGAIYGVAKAVKNRKKIGEWFKGKAENHKESKKTKKYSEAKPIDVPAEDIDDVEK